MAMAFQASRDVILRTPRWREAIHFYSAVMCLRITHESETLVGFETGGFCLYVEKGSEHGPVFEFWVPQVQGAKQQLLAAGCTLVEEDSSTPRCYIQDPFGLVFNIGRAPDSA